MPTIQDQYTEIAQHTQDATAAIAQAWTQSLQDVAKVPVAVTPEAATSAAQLVIDQAYDFVTKVIDVQRTLSKQLITSSATVAQDVVQRATIAINDAGAQAFAAATTAGQAAPTSE